MSKFCNFPGCGRIIDRGSYCEYHQNRERYCKHPGCPNKVSGSDGPYCPLHKPSRIYDRKRRDESGRVYDSNWAKISKNALKRRPLCQLCLLRSRVMPAVLVHHIKPIRDGGDKYDPENLMSVCTSCHAELHSLLKGNRNMYNLVVKSVIESEED